jgi:hypothetical protein
LYNPCEETRSFKGMTKSYSVTAASTDYFTGFEHDATLLPVIRFSFVVALIRYFNHCILYFFVNIMVPL